MKITTTQKAEIKRMANQIVAITAAPESLAGVNSFYRFNDAARAQIAAIRVRQEAIYQSAN